MLQASRIKTIIPKIISSDQTGYIKDRYIGENISTVINTMQYVTENNIPGIILQLHFEKAFDFKSWNFLHKTLKIFNFGKLFKNWVKLIYSQPQCCVINNGYISTFFSICGGI